MSSSNKRGSLYEESYEMLLGAVVIYVFAEMRQMIREGKLPEVKIEDLEPPLTARRALEVIELNREALQERALDHEYLASRLKALRSAILNEPEPTTDTISASSSNISSSDKKESSSSYTGNLVNYLQSSLQSKKNGTKGEDVDDPLKEPMVLAKFMDERSDSEIVHAIVLNHVRKRVSIVFRGSVTNKDFLQDAKCAQIKVANPVLKVIKDGKMPEHLNLHSGFYEYLFFKEANKEEDGGSDDNKEEDADSKPTRLEIILADAKEQLEKYPGYSLYCTGHSLGGALATLCGFYAACDHQLLSMVAGQRVVVYSIASPYCGNWKFRYAFQELERKRRVQHLRFTNLEDMVTLLPFAVPKATIMSPALSLMKGAGNLYKHVGIRFQVKMVGDGQYEHSFSYPKEQQASDDDEEYANELQDAVDSGKSLISAFYHLCKNDFETVQKYHSCDEYETRLQSCQEPLATLTLDELYDDKKIVGKLFAHDFSPALLENGLSRTLRALSFLGRRKSSSNVDDDQEESATLSEAALASQK